MNEQLFVVTSDDFEFPKHTVFLAEYDEDRDDFQIIDCDGNWRFVDYLSMKDFCKIEDYTPNKGIYFDGVAQQSEKFKEAFSTSCCGENDVVKKPTHYQLFPEHNLEVKDINKRLLDRIEESDFDMTLYEAGWYQQAMQYFQRFYAKNGIEDIEKGIQTMQFVLDSWKNR